MSANRFDVVLLYALPSIWMANRCEFSDAELAEYRNAVVELAGQKKAKEDMAKRAEQHQAKSIAGGMVGVGTPQPVFAENGSAVRFPPRQLPLFCRRFVAIASQRLCCCCTRPAATSLSMVFRACSMRVTRAPRVCYVCAARAQRARRACVSYICVM